MKKIWNFMRAILLGCTFVALSVGNSLAANPDFAAKASKSMLAAVMANDYGAFMAKKNKTFQEVITKELFQSINFQRSPRMKQGYENIYLGTFKRQGFDIYYWKLTYKDGGDDTLVTLTVQNGEVAGFWMQ